MTAVPTSPPSIPRVPQMPPQAVNRLGELMRSAKVYLEYGSGGSTFMALDSGMGMTISVESDLAWLRTLEQQAASTPGERILLHGDIGPTVALGHPASDQHWRKWKQYPLTPWTTSKERGLEPDLVLIDGRFRVACFCASLLFAKPGVTLLFDDYVERTPYHVVEQFVQPIARHDRMAEFVRPEELDRDAVWLALMEGVTAPF